MDNVNSDIRISSTLSSSFYSSKKKFKEVIDKIFAKSWHLITDDTHFDEENYVYPFILMDNVLPEPLFLIKNKNGIDAIRAVTMGRNAPQNPTPSVISFQICLKTLKWRRGELNPCPTYRWRHLFHKSGKPNNGLEPLTYCLQNSCSIQLS